MQKEREQPYCEPVENRLRGEAESNWLEVCNRRDGGWAGWAEVDTEVSMMKVSSRYIEMTRYAERISKGRR